MISINTKHLRTLNRRISSPSLRHSTSRSSTYSWVIYIVTHLAVSSILYTAFATGMPPEPTAGERATIRLFERFDEMYARRQNNNADYLNQWVSLAEELTSTRVALGLHHNLGLRFQLRATLIAGQCYLFASQDYFAQDDPQFLSFYEKGITTLEALLNESDGIHATGYIQEWDDLDHNFLPNYSHHGEIRQSQDGYYTHLHPLTGRETIGTGIEHHSSYRDRRVTYDRRSYTDLSGFSDDIRSDFIGRRRIRQFSTAETARYFLAEFCPWGVQTYFFLKEAGLTNDLDMRILRPFSGQSAFVTEQSLEILRSLSDLVMGSPSDSNTGIRSLISESVLRPPRIPKHIHDEMQTIIGDRSQGFLDTLRRNPIRWAWVEPEPTYTLWYVSPALMGWQATDYLRFWFAAVRILFNPSALIADETIDVLLNVLGTACGEDSDIYFLSNVLVEANDKGFLTDGFIEKAEWLSAPAITRKIASYGFKGAESKILEGVFGRSGLDPRQFALGATYNGDAIPPIVIRSEVFGFEEVPEDEYNRTITAVRLFRFHPDNVAYTGVFRGYDLSSFSRENLSPLLRKDQYLAEQNRYGPDGGPPEVVRKWAWNKLPDPLLHTFEIVTDFAPKTQQLIFHLSEDAIEALSGTHTVVAELWTNDVQNPQHYATATLEEGTGSFSFLLYNRNNPDAVSAFEAGRWGLQEAGTMPTAGISLTDEHRARVPGISGLLEENRRRVRLVDIKNQYELRMIADGTRVVPPYKVVLLESGARQRAVTGSLTSPAPGEVVLHFSPEVDIVRLKVRTGQVVPSGASDHDRPRR